MTDNNLESGRWRRVKKKFYNLFWVIVFRAGEEGKVGARGERDNNKSEPPFCGNIAINTILYIYISQYLYQQPSSNNKGETMEEKWTISHHDGQVNEPVKENEKEKQL